MDLLKKAVPRCRSACQEFSIKSSVAHGLAPGVVSKFESDVAKIDQECWRPFVGGMLRREAFELFDLRRSKPPQAAK